MSDSKQQNCGIYKIENLINAKKYIGQSICITDRWKQHRVDGFNPNSKVYDRPLYRSFRKYGLKNFSFEILELCDSEKLNEREVYWIKFYDSFNNGYNLTPGGNEPIKIIPSELYQLWDEGYSVAEITDILKVNSHTTTKWLKTYDKYSKAEAFRRGGLRAKEKMKNNSNTTFSSKKIVQYTMDGQEIRKWDAIRQAQRELSLQSTGPGISNCLNRKSYQCGGYRWGYEGESLPTKDEIKSHAKGVILTEEMVKQIKELLTTGISQVKIAEQLNISRHVITKINTGAHWKDDGVYPIYDYKKKKANR